jgi:hypothetical protein
MAAPASDSMGEKQTIQARHGVATFVPKGHTIKIINTYGRQVVDTWAFALHAPPEDSDIDKGDKERENEAPESSETKAPKTPEKKAAKTAQKAGDAAEGVASTAQKTTEKVTEKGKDVAESAEKASEKVTETVEAPAEKKGWSSYIPSVRGRGKAAATDAKPDEAAAEGESAEKQDDMTKSWSSYLPSVYGSKSGPAENINSQSKGWSSYIPSGVGYSSYMPSKSTLSAFASTHNRDPTKSYAEQLYDFSKTPVGAAGISGK